jgi:hypothetical protein
VLFTFPSRYWFTIGHRGVLRLGGWSPHVRTGFHVPRPTRGPKITLARTGLSPAVARLSRRFRFVIFGHWPGPRSLATTCGVSKLMSFPPATEMVQFAGFASSSYGFTEGYPLGGGLPHSEISGSTGARPSPELFAACHVLHRLSVPRHSPDALLSSSPTPSPKRARARADVRGRRSEGQTAPKPSPTAGALVPLHLRSFA